MNDPDSALVVAGIAVSILAVLGVASGLLIARSRSLICQSRRRHLLVVIVLLAPAFLGAGTASVFQLMVDQREIDRLRNSSNYNLGYEEHVIYQGPFVSTYWIWHRDAEDSIEATDPRVIELRSMNELPPVGGAGARGYGNSLGNLIAVHLWFATVALAIFDLFALLAWWLFRPKPVQKP